MCRLRSGFMYTIIVFVSISEMGAHCVETGTYICEPWHPVILEQARTQESGNVSVPFLESFCILVAVLTLGRADANIFVNTDCTAAADICSDRWCKTNTYLNNYIAYFDYECARHGILMQVEERDTWRTPAFARTSSQSQKVRQPSTSCDRAETSTTLLEEMEQILSTDLQRKTVDCYTSAIKQYRVYANE